MRTEIAVGPFLLHLLHLTRHWSRQGKPETWELGAIPCNWLMLPNGCERELKSHPTNA
jgi:hypothetical protein